VTSSRKTRLAAKSAALTARETELRRKHWRARLNSVLARMLGGRQYVLKELFWRCHGLVGRWRAAILRQPIPAQPQRATQATRASTEYIVDLPSHFGARRAVVRLSVPKLPRGHIYSFSEHLRAPDGAMTDRVIACTTGGFALSDDLGRTFREVRLKGFGHYPITHSRILKEDEILLQAVDPDDPGIAPKQNSCLLISDLAGNVVHSAKVRGALWHGPRAVDLRDGTLMYAEYTQNGIRTGPQSPPHWPSRIWRSRDLGRSWEMVREEPDVRHFHFLQAHPRRKREWWLTAGDGADESRIWKSSDDGDTWVDQTGKFGNTVSIAGSVFSRRLFRLTDLIWDGEDLIWGSDDVLRPPHRHESKQGLLGARVFRGNPASGTVPAILGNCGPEVRNIVEVGDFYLLTTQSSHHYANNDAPRVFLMPKTARGEAGGVHHLFDVERHAPGRTGFTYSRASRAAKNGVFFSFRTPTDVFRAQNRILKWEVRFD
jgi:hypothetical protein